MCSLLQPSWDCPLWEPEAPKAGDLSATVSGSKNLKKIGALLSGRRMMERKQDRGL